MCIATTPPKPKFDKKVVIRINSVNLWNPSQTSFYLEFEFFLNLDIFLNSDLSERLALDYSFCLSLFFLSLEELDELLDNTCPVTV